MKRELVWRCSCGRVLGYAGEDGDPTKMLRVIIWGVCPECRRQIRRVFVLGNDAWDRLYRSMEILCGKKLKSRVCGRYTISDGRHSPNRDYAHWVLRHQVTSPFVKPKSVREIGRVLRAKGIKFPERTLKTMIDNAYPTHYVLTNAPPWCSGLSMRRLRAYFGRSTTDKFIAAARRGEEITVLAAIIDERLSIAKYLADYATGQISPKTARTQRWAKLVNSPKKLREACMFCNIADCDREGQLCIMEKVGVRAFSFIQGGVDKKL